MNMSDGEMCYEESKASNGSRVPRVVKQGSLVRFHLIINPKKVREPAIQILRETASQSEGTARAKA